MLNFLFGRALLRMLEKLAPEEEAQASPDDPVGSGQPRPQNRGTQGAVRLAAPDLPTTQRPGDPPLDLTSYTIIDRPKPPEVVYPKVQRAAMGSLFEVYLAGTDRELLLAAGEEALNEIERLEDQLSHYREASDITRINLNAAEQWVRLEPRLYDLLRRCAKLSEETDGAFDITAGPLVKAWGFFRGEGRVPTDDEIADTLGRVGFYRLLWDDAEHMLRFVTPGVELHLGAVGKGFAMDAAAEVLRFYGVSSAVIHGGQSTIHALGAPPYEPEGWEFTIRDPRDHETPIETVRLKDQALSTSGNAEQFFEVDGVRYGHLIDPLTGRPTRGVLQVSVIAPSAADSDALSTAFFVLGPEPTEEFCRSHPNIRVIMVAERPNNDIAIHRFGF
jgi:thiamine biosynthesis lipoprotein